MRVIITGGSGLIGRMLTESLAVDNHEVIVLSRDPKQVTNLPHSVKVVRWDGRTTVGWEHFVDGADAIVNLAGAPIAEGRWSSKRKRLLKESRVNAGRAIVKAVEVAENKPGVVVQASAVGYYGPRDNEMLTENSRPGNDFLARLTAKWETSTEPVEALGVRRVIIRTGVVLSRAGGAFPKILLPFKLFAGGPLGSGKQWFPWIHQNDEVAAIRFLIENDAASGPFNLTAPRPVTNAEFGRQLGRAMGRPAIMPAPTFAIRTAFGEVSTVLLDGQRAVPHRLQEFGFKFQFSTPEAALQDLLMDKYQHKFQVKAPIADVAEFHTKSKSMGDITPPPVVVKVHQAPPELKEGDEMDFSMWLGPMPIHWVARIENVTPNSFVDRQLDGPFNYWAHQHTFEPINESTTAVVDEIKFNLHSNPFWRFVGWNMKLTLPILFAYRGWKTRQGLEAGQTDAVGLGQQSFS